MRGRVAWAVAIGLLTWLAVDFRGGQAEQLATPTTEGAEAASWCSTFSVSAYTCYELGGCGVMADGRGVYLGAAAVDSRVIPLGSTIVFEANGGEAVYTASDTGSAVYGNRIDLFFGWSWADYVRARQWGRRNVVACIY